MKDELNGNIIEKAIFLGPKKYAFQYTENGVTNTVAVFAGLTRNLLTFQDFKILAYGGQITVDNKPVFTRNMNNLTINVVEGRKFSPDTAF